MARYIDTIVIGASATGSAAAWQLAGRGTEVVVFELEGAEVAEKARGVCSLAPFTADALTLRLAAEAREHWGVLESLLGRRLLDSGSALWMPGSELSGRAVGAGGSADAEILAAETAAGLWPGIRFAGSVLHVPGAARIEAGAGVGALRGAAVAVGVEFRYRERVTRIRVLGDERALVEVCAVGAAGEALEEVREFECRRLVVAVGARTAKLAGGVLVLPRLVVSQQQPARFAARAGAASRGAESGGAQIGGGGAGSGIARAGDARSAGAGSAGAGSGGAGSGGAGDGGPVSSGAWPIWRHDPVVGDRRSGYWRGSAWGAPAGDGAEVVWSAPGAAAAPDAGVGFRSERRRRTALQHYVREWLPGLDHEQGAERGEVAVSTRDGHPVIDRVGPVTVATALSDLGTGFAPAVGVLVADLADGVRAPAALSLRPDRRASASAWAAATSPSAGATTGRREIG
ncbi:FAD-dependent oxidoreductase [Herbiconiux sp. A18JL235]|uniref:FAD-dependent oxidoreductase n=1 Tax=Herbiconiux sp. A18JL235 TaxID=3152363 RepID=A0AB39BDE8_9MICO